MTAMHGVPSYPVCTMMAQRETKFVLNNSGAHVALAWLESHSDPDPHFPRGLVSSIYYDSPDWHHLREKINSDYLKTKIRVRWYADIDGEEPGSASFAEAKHKQGGRRTKVRVKTRHSGRWLAETELSVSSLRTVPWALREKGIFVCPTLCPAFQISYKRRRFVDRMTGVALCLDFDICVPKVNPQMIPRGNPFRLNQAVFEMKGPGVELPLSLRYLARLGCRKGSFSKYEVCHERLAGPVG